MFNIKHIVTKFVQKEHGISMIEYGVIAALIAVAGISATTTLGNNNSAMYCTISRNLGSDATCGSKLASKDFLTAAQGGTLNTENNAQQWHSEIPGLTLSILNDINAKDKIASVYGIFTNDPDSGEPMKELTNLSSITALLSQADPHTYSTPDWSTVNDLSSSANGGAPLFQVVTESGQVYTVNGIDQGGTTANGQATSDPRSFYETVTNSSGKIVETSSVQGYGNQNITSGTFTG